MVTSILYGPSAIVRSISARHAVYSFATAGSIFLILRLGFHMLKGSDEYLTLLEDDFYYYVCIAKNIILEGSSTFDGQTITNGYHPLWMGVVIMLGTAFGFGDPFFIAVSVVQSICFFTCCHLFFKLCSAFALEALPTIALTFAAGFLSYRMISTGMEIMLTLPLLLYCLRYGLNNKFGGDFTKHIQVGLLLSLIMLSRLDSVIFVALYVLAWFTIQRTKKEILVRGALGIAFGLIPTAIYFAFNYFHYGHIETVSAAAKQLSLYPSFNLDTLASTLEFTDGSLLPFIPLSLIFLLVTKRIKLTTEQRLLIILGLTFPIVHILAVCIRSPWIFFSWYLYTLPAGFFCAGLIIFHYIERFSSPLARRVFVAATCVIIGLTIYKVYFNIATCTVNYWIGPNSIYSHAKRINGFVAAHSGSYAMGDRAGLTSYLLDKPLLQIEGLTADFTLLEHISHQDPLLDVLHKHEIDYLIVSIEKPLVKTTRGYFIEAPSSLQSGINSPKMSDYIASEPLFTYHTVTYTGQPMFTYIFKITERILGLAIQGKKL